jgi:phosphonate transport system substrate-binding protein
VASHKRNQYVTFLRSVLGRDNQQQESTVRSKSMIVAAAIAVTAATSGSAVAENYKLAITDVEGLERLQTEWGPFKQAVEKATGHTFEFFSVSNRTAAVEALRAKRVDFVITGPAEYVIINKLTDAKPLVGLSRPDYFCAIVVKADSKFIKPADLKGKKVGLDDIGSTSGHLCPSQLLADFGVNPTKDLGKITHTSRAVAHEALKRGDVDAIGVNYTSWVNGVRNKDTNTPPGSFRVIARSGDLPNDMVIVGTHVDAAQAKKIREAMVTSKNVIIESILSPGGENTKYRGMDMVIIEDSAYDPVRSMYRTLGYPQYSNFIGE